MLKKMLLVAGLVFAVGLAQTQGVITNTPMDTQMAKITTVLNQAGAASKTDAGQLQVDLTTLKSLSAAEKTAVVKVLQEAETAIQATIVIPDKTGNYASSAELKKMLE